MKISSHHLRRAALLLVLVALALGLWLEHVELLLHKSYSVDEFEYAHGAWLISKGKVIYRDFFEHHFPLIHQLMAVPFLFFDDDPNNLIVLRLLMLPFLTLTALWAWQLNAPRCGRWGLATAVMVLLVPTWSVMSTQVRPDPIAAAFFTGALAVLGSGLRSARWRGFWSGLLLGLASWATLKVVYYGLVFPAALAVDLFYNRPRRSLARPGRSESSSSPSVPEGGASYLLASPFAFIAGGLTVAVPIAVYLTWTASWSDWFEWSIRWSFLHQWHYPSFPWLRNFTPLFDHSFWIFPLAVCGVITTLRDRRRLSSVDLLLLGSLVTTFFSFAWQTAAYLYSLIPFTVILVVFAGRGTVAACRWLGRSGTSWGLFGLIVLSLLLTVEVRRGHGAIRKLLLTTNDEQQDFLARIGRLTRPDEPVFHIAGGQVTRPSVHFFYFHEAVIRKLKNDVFAFEVPRAMLEKGCIAYAPSDRFYQFPEPLRRFLLASYMPMSRDLWFWGRRYPVPAAGGASGGEISGDFFAVRTGRYFVWPLETVSDGELEIDGHRLQAPVLDLTAGPHPIAYRGPASELYLVWLPADGRPFVPRPGFKPPLNE